MPRQRKKLIVLLALLVIVGIVMIWFKLDYSPLRQQFMADVAAVRRNVEKPTSALVVRSDFAHLPPIIQRYLEQSGYIGKPRMAAIHIEFGEVAFKRDKVSPPMTMTYTQYNFIDRSARLALMKSSLFGVPFEGYDYYLDGRGGMKGVIGKLVTLFHQTGAEMDKAALVTYLSECLLVLSTLLEGYIEFQELDDCQVRAMIRDGETSVSGVFRFNDAAEMISFTSDERAATMPDGTMQIVPWSIECADYQVNALGIRFPRHVSATWHYPEGNLVYFEGVITHISNE